MSKKLMGSTSELVAARDIAAHRVLMEDDEDVIEVVVPVDEIEINSLAAGKTIWNEITAGVGVWGAMRPIFAVALSLVPFLFLGQHFNKKHGRFIK